MLNLAYFDLRGEHEHTKILRGFGGTGVIEIIESDESGTYRAIYTVKMLNVIFVLHTFKKKSKHGIKTPKQEVDLIETRLKQAQELYKELVFFRGK
jgi:phage-related protein